MPFGGPIKPATFGGSAAGSSPGASNAARPQPAPPPSYPPQYPQPGAYGQPPSLAYEQQGVGTYGQPQPGAYAQPAVQPYGQPAPYGQQPQTYEQPPSPYQAGPPSAAPYQPGPTYPVHAAATLDPPRRKSKGLLIGGIGVIAVGAGIAVAVAVSGGKTKPGVSSRDEVAAQTLAAIQKGDADALVALTPPAEPIFATCEDKDKLADKETRSREHMKDRFEKVIGKAKGVEVELVKLGESKKQTLAKGDEAGRGCKLDVDITLHTIDIALKLKAGGLSKQRDLKIEMLEGDGRWFLTEPPKIVAPGDCAAVAKVTIANAKDIFVRQGLGNTAIARIQKMVDQSCNDDAWSDDAIACFIVSKSDPDSETCMKMMAKSQQDNVVKHMGQIIADDVKSRAVPVPVATERVQAPVDPTVPPAGSGSGTGSGSAETVSSEIPPICNDYREQLDKLARCRRVPAKIRKGFEDEYAIIVKSWNDTKKTEAIRESTERSCKSGVDQALELRKGLCR